MGIAVLLTRGKEGVLNGEVGSIGGLSSRGNGGLAGGRQVNLGMGTTTNVQVLLWCPPVLLSPSIPKESSQGYRSLF